MELDKRTARIPHLQRNIVAGVLVLMPILVTWIAFAFISDQLARLGRPWVPAFFRAVYRFSPDVADLLFSPLVEFTLALALSLTFLYLLGRATTHVLGRRALSWFEAKLDRIPMVKTVYGSTKMLLAALQTKPEGVQRVVLIDFPSPDMKTVGFVTRILRDATSGTELAVVYVPTSPNPTSGYMEIVPVDKVISTDWTVEEAMRFIITGGVTAPDTITYSKPRRWSRP